MGKRTLTALIFITLLMSILLPSCKSRKPEKPRVALVMKSLANEFFKTMEDGARDHQELNSDKYDLIVVGIKDELDVAQQIDLVAQNNNVGDRAEI